MKLAIIDTKACNLNSVYQALKRLDCDIITSSNEKELVQADKYILPGVGSAQAVMHGIENFHLQEFICNTKKDLLGICLGMQIQAKESLEVPLNSDVTNIACLNIIDACVQKIDSKEQALPHMGWNQISFSDNNPLFANISPNAFFYFVHSYCIAVNPYTIATCNYGMDFSAAINKDNFYGVQFHPEKSGLNGHKLLENFIKL